MTETKPSQPVPTATDSNKPTVPGSPPPRGSVPSVSGATTTNQQKTVADAGASKAGTPRNRSR